LERTPCSTMLKTISPKSSAPRSRPTADCEKKSSKNDVQKCPPNAAGAGRKIKDKNQACKKPTTTKPYNSPSLLRSVINHLLRSLIQKRAGIPSTMNPSLNRNPLIILEGETAFGRHHWYHPDRVGPNSNPAPGIQETAEAPGTSDEAGALPKVIESTLACLILALLVSFPARAVEPTPLSLNRIGPDLKLSWPATQPQPTGSVRRPYF